MTSSCGEQNDGDSDIYQVLLRRAKKLQLEVPRDFARSRRQSSMTSSGPQWSKNSNHDRKIWMTLSVANFVVGIVPADGLTAWVGQLQEPWWTNSDRDGQLLPKITFTSRSILLVYCVVTPSYPWFSAKDLVGIYISYIAVQYSTVLYVTWQR